MILTKKTFSLLAALLSVTSTSVWASGSTTLGGRGYNQPSSTVRQVDQTYEYGKAVYKGRVEGVVKRKYCVDVNGEKLPLKRRTLKPHKAGSYHDFANALFDCEQPSQKIAENLTDTNLQHVLYYLNKRYRLKLSNLSDF